MTELNFIEHADFKQIHEGQRAYFKSDATQSVSFRKSALLRLKKELEKNEMLIYQALYEDLKKSNQEGFLTEYSIVMQEIKLHLKKLNHWSKPQKVTTPVHLWPSKSYIQAEPLGVVLIISPWNYPFQLTLNPLIGAISSGCCAIVKPSPSAGSTSRIIEEILSNCFDEHYIKVVQGAKIETEFILKEKFDSIFFTGSTYVGRAVMLAAAQHLTPVVLELGGKSPCIIDKDANLKVAAKRIAWSKTVNAGQTCIAPDYVIVHQEIKEELVELMAEAFEELFGKEIEKSETYSRIIDENAFDRLVSYIDMGNIRFGGNSDKKNKFISPTIIDEVSFEDEVMKNEIFGPILPIIEFKSLDEVSTYLKQQEKPLAMYFYGNTKRGKDFFRSNPCGGGCINDGLIHIANSNLPFGGTGNSGLGRYHGKSSFDVFTNYKGIVVSPTWIDLPFRYPPFRFFKWIKRFL